MPPRASSPSDDEALREQCVAYLLGELDTQQAAAFEQRLADPQTAEWLVAESRLISELASDGPWSRPNTARTAPAHPALPCPAPAHPATVHTAPAHTATPDTAAGRFRSIATLMAAIAAVVLIASLLSRRQANSNTAMRASPSQLIDALVEPAIAWTDPAESLPPQGFDEFDPWEEDAVSINGEDTATDESLSWMVVAVKAAGLREDNGDG